MDYSIPTNKRLVIPIILGTRAARIRRIANSGENCGWDYKVVEEEHCFYSLYNFPISDELKPILTKFGNRIQSCDYEEWLPCGEEHRLSYDSELTLKLCAFLNSFFNLTAPYLNLEFLPGEFETERSDWQDHGPIKFIYPLAKP